MKKSYIYTHSGDKGTTGLIGGTRISKKSKQIEAYGTIDELNSFIGLLRSYISDEHDDLFLLHVQNTLFLIGGILATDTTKISSASVGVVTAENVKSIEIEIDTIDEKLVPQKSFIIPGGCRGASVAHVCRTVCRRAERAIYAFMDEDHNIPSELLEFINRLSDYFFVLSRKVNADKNTEEILWDKTCI
jgi:cob(I)alamin adenosyltransferase